MTNKGTHRVCSCGCGRALVDANGNPDFSRRRFALKECRDRDTERRISAYRKSSAYLRAQEKKQYISPVNVKVGDQILMVPSAKAAFELIKKHGELGQIELVKAKRARRKAEKQ
jgi:hypothetical protein